MTVTDTKELRAAAEYLLSMYCEGSEVAKAAQHILATVREDDGEPVSREWLHSLGGVDVPSQLGATYDDEVRFGSLYLWDYNGECWLMRGEDSFELKTKRQIRDLFAALGIEVSQ